MEQHGKAQGGRYGMSEESSVLAKQQLLEEVLEGKDAMVNSIRT
jgi:hypothetical protein